MSKNYIISLDQGTTSSRAILYDINKKAIIGMKNKPFTQIYPNSGWVEHDPEEIWEGQLEVMKAVIEEAGVSYDDIVSIGIANQRETVVVWDRITGKPIYNAIVWQCRRTADICETLKKEGLEDVIKEKTGLVVDAYFSGTKIQWILDNVEGAREKAQRNELMVGTIDSWLIWNLTGGKIHVTDYTNASRTMLFNIKKLKWDEELLEHMNIPMSMMPSVVPSSGRIAVTDKYVVGCEIPISGVAGDQQASLFGQTCFDVGCAKNTYGTGCFILMNIGDKPISSKNNLITTIGWVIGNEVKYALEGSVFNAGSTIQWIRDELGLIKTSEESRIEAEKVNDTNGVYLVPAFTGLGAPYWDMYARGAILGITRGTRREHLIRAALESIAYQSMDVLELMKLDSGIELKELKVDGGASANDFLMQFQADMLNINIKRPTITETTALGAVYLAGLGEGIWKSKDELIRSWSLDRTFAPRMTKRERDDKSKGWKKAVAKSLAWEEA
ncbi:glycerol kinase GlpK [Lutispora thermophila]|uniref:Glycerol kinase n=1 Tax=Lutispora thermophila DSM 19022 TaxID=1122184 RepID=A0A1M6CBG3_9FIRM|nr:glycerol kinase GlpK [Lutispora thermophila]SHI58349.1 glycerol kinase [Lutispora thermophila DSM 19022]